LSNDARRNGSDRPQPNVLGERATSRADALVVVNRWTAPLACVLQVALRDDIYEFAARLSAGWRTVADWQAKPEILPKRRMQRALDAALRQTDHEAKIRFANLTRGNPLVWVSDSLGLDGNGAATYRNQVLKILRDGLAGAAIAPLGELGEALERIAAGGLVDDRLVTSHERIAAWLVSEHRTADPRELLPVVGAEADRVLEKLKQPMTDAQRTQLNTVAVGVHAQAGLLVFDIGHWGTAYRYLATALGIAARSGNQTLHAQALGLFANLYSPILRGGLGGDYKETVALLDQATDLAAGHADGLTLVDLHTFRAAEHGNAGKAELSKADLEAAEQALQLSAGPDHQFFSAAGLYGDMQARLEQGWGLTHAAARRFDDAEATLSRALRTAVSGRRQVMVLIRLGTVRVQAGEPEGACATLTQALDQAIVHDYMMGVQRIRGIRVGFPEPWIDLACVREFDERLRFAIA
jgi:tetratricopeptide (TPR) repeat protein